MWGSSRFGNLDALDFSDIMDKGRELVVLVVSKACGFFLGK
jgi:hypothetical protein